MLCHNKNHKLNTFKVIHKDIIKILMMINIEIELNHKNDIDDDKY